MVLSKDIYIGKKIRNKIGTNFEEIKLIRQTLENMYIIFDNTDKFSIEEKETAKEKLDYFYSMSKQIDSLKEQFSIEHDNEVEKEQARIDAIKAQKLAEEQAKLDAIAKQELYDARVQELIGQGVDEEQASTQAYEEIYNIN